MKAKLDQIGAMAKISFDVPLGGSLKFVRGITKIAFSLLAKHIGPHRVLDTRYHAVRRFVLSGDGVRHIVISADEDTNYRHEIAHATFKSSGNHAVMFRLGIPEFLVEFSPEDRFPDLAVVAHERRPGQWTVLPIEN